MSISFIKKINFLLIAFLNFPHMIEQEQCVKTAQKIMETIKNMNIQCADGLEGRVSVSIGIGRMIPVKGAEPDSLINAADQALYRAKKEGRDCYRIW